MLGFLNILFLYIKVVFYHYFYPAMKLLTYTPSLLTLFIILGIVTGFYFNPSQKIILGLLVFFLISLIISFYITNKSFKQVYHFSMATYLLFFTIGIASITFKNQLNHKKHYLYFIEKENEILVQIEKQLKSNNYYDKYTGNVSQLNDNKTLGDILINIKKDSVQKKEIYVGDILLIKTNFKEINKPLNPFQFDYHTYLKKQQIHHQINIKKEEFLFIKHRNTVSSYVNNIYKKVNNSLIKNGFKKEELSIINALILGQRKGISKDLLQSYTNAGAIHILAVSGLHIGILVLLLNLLFKPFELLKHGKTIKIILIVLFLWLYAVIAGLSPSIIRAVTMFTALSIGMYSNKKTPTIHSLIISIFILLLINPYYLFSVGFQLSYLAVFSIVYFYPLFIRLYNPKLWLFRKAWQLFSISLSAQLGILPLSLYYFHQFPALFFVSSIVIIPFLGIILGLGILVILLASLEILPIQLAQIFIWIIHQMNIFIALIARQESFLFKHITFSILLLISSYLVILGIYYLWKKPKATKLKYVLISVLIFQGILFFEKYKLQSSNEFLILNQSKKSILINREEDQATIYHNIDSIKLQSNYTITNYHTGTGNIKIVNKPLSNYYKFRKTTILIVDSLGIYQIPKLKTDLIILTQSPKINLNRLITINKPKMIIADKSNYKSYKKRWKNTCNKQGIPFYDTSISGAFQYPY
jgi:competence protein ComEC